MIEIYQIFSHPQDHDVVEVLHERSITGHGAVRSFSRFFLEITQLTLTFFFQQAIYNLKFSLSHPHLLASASDDSTVRLWSSQIPDGSNSAMKIKIEENVKIANSKLESGKGGVKPPHGATKWKLGNESVERHLVKGEMLAMLADEGHRGGALSCVSPSFHFCFSSSRLLSIML